MSNKTLAVSFRLTAEHNRKLDEMTSATNSSKTALVKDIIDAEYKRYLRREKKS